MDGPGERRLPAVDPRCRRSAPARFRAPWPVPADQQRRLLLCCGRLRRRRGPARRPGLHQGRPPFPDPCGPGNLPVRARGPCLDFLHPGGAGRRGPGAGQRVAHRGHEHPRVHVAEVLRQAFPLPRPPHRQGHGQPHCRPAQRKTPPARGHALPGHRHAGTLRGPVGLPLNAGKAEPGRSRTDDPQASGTRHRGQDPLSGTHRDEDRAPDRRACPLGNRLPHHRARGRPGPGHGQRLETRGVPAQPDVLREATAGPFHLGHPAFPHQLRRNPRGRPDPAARGAPAAGGAGAQRGQHAAA